MLMCLYASGIGRFHCGARQDQSRPQFKQPLCLARCSIDRCQQAFSASTFFAPDLDARIVPKWRSEPCFELLWADRRR
jgi:hypothetical protein